MDIKERIKELCKKNGISMNALEKELGLGIGYISKLGKSTPNAKYLQKIADRFGVTTDYIMTGIEKSLDEKYGDDMTHLYALIRNDAELSKALHKYFTLTKDKKKHVLELIDFL